MSSAVAQLKLDIEELNSFLETATRQRTKDLLSLEVRKLQTKLETLTEEKDNVTPAVTESPSNVSHSCYEVKLNNYGWDQTDKTVNLYVTLKDVHKLAKDSIQCNFTEMSLDLRVLGLDNKNYKLLINNLCESIDPAGSYFKVKTDMVVIYLAKQVRTNWSHVTGVEKRMKDSKTSHIAQSMKEDSNPGERVINLMKNLYNNGDPEMKKIIEKSWTETRKNFPGNSDFNI